MKTKLSIITLLSFLTLTTIFAVGIFWSKQNQQLKPAVSSRPPESIGYNYKPSLQNTQTTTVNHTFTATSSSIENNLYPFLEDAPDGSAILYGKIEKVEFAPTSSKLTFHLVEFTTQTNAEQAALEAGACSLQRVETRKCTPKNFFIRETDKHLTLPVAADATIKIFTSSSTKEDISLADLANTVSLNSPSEAKSLKDQVFVFRTVHGSIASIQQQFLPSIYVKPASPDDQGSEIFKPTPLGQAVLNGKIENIDLAQKAGEVAFQLVEWEERGSNLEQAALEGGRCSLDTIEDNWCLGENFFIRDTKQRLSLQVSQSVVIRVYARDSKGGVGFKSNAQGQIYMEKVSFASFIKMIGQFQDLKASPFTFTTTHGIITKIEENYVP